MLEHAPDADPAGPYLQQDFDPDFHVRDARGCGDPVLTDILCDQFQPTAQASAAHGTVR
ncbi:hypothetical protein [Aureimonas sp. Leaf324]|jgi:hypothetical protein|uniref:hypothetical protein n=1 Tax=Aureimonas sp. Leaf324 TaxID=1736336 RepID=UPI000A6593A1|nr:hypothetical protein [Aureimonas sp. Leaf324]